MCTTSERRHWTLSHKQGPYGDLRGMPLTDAWTQNPTHSAYTHYTPTSASRLDCFHMTRDLTPKLEIQILPAAFTDHKFVGFRIAVTTTEARRGWRRWKMNPNTMDDGVRMHIRHEFEQWRHYKQYYTDVASWWERCVKSVSRNSYDGRKLSAAQITE